MAAPPRKRALVTGSNRGIGRAIASALARRDDVCVIAAARLAADAEATAADLGRGSVGLALDLGAPAQAEAALTAFMAREGEIDILVNNAGVLNSGTGLGASVEDVTHSFAVNTIGPYALARAVASGMQARGWGRIVNVSSGWGSFAEGLGGPVAYAASKAALNALTVSLARALGPAVKVNAACPGWVRTRMGGAGASLSPAQAAETPVWLATLPDDGPTGGFFRERAPIAW
ncbi:MAG: SDR family NAD(P)-dependent oxidoreductase [Myxococcota bacterium]